MNIELKMSFASVEEMNAFVNGRTAGVPTIENTPAGPAVVETVVTPIAPAAVAPAAVAPAAVAPAAVAPLAAVPDLPVTPMAPPALPGAPAAAAATPADEDAVFAAVKAALIAVSKGPAGKEGVSQFLSQYGYSRLSDIPKSQLGSLQAALAAAYPQ